VTFLIFFIIYLLSLILLNLFYRFYVNKLGIEDDVVFVSLLPVLNTFMCLIIIISLCVFPLNKLANFIAGVKK
jgi:hypothetical protein